MERRLLLCCLCLCLVGVAAVKYNEDIAALQTIDDLKKTTFGQAFPRHGLLLLFWIANNVEIDQNEVIRPINFNPLWGDYGFHRYWNRESDLLTHRAALPDVSNMDSVYCSLGNLNARPQLPGYVTQDYNNAGGHVTRNMDRVVIRASNSQNRIEEVYITQHYFDRNRGSGYDPDHTYRVLPSLLREIQGITTDDACIDDSPCEILDDEQKILDLQRAYPHVPGLVRFMIRAGYNPNRVIRFSETFSCWTSITQKRRPRSLDTFPKCPEHNNINLEVKSTSKGYARITWSGIPENLLKMQMNVGLYEEETGTQLELYPLNERPYGTIDTSTALKPGLHIGLVSVDRIDSGFLYETTYYTDVWSGPEFDEANGVLPTDIRGYDARLQLYTSGGYVCARLYIRKSFTDWKNVFKNSWVGLYKRTLDDNHNYKKYTWSTNFKKTSNQGYAEDYDIYIFESGMTVGPGVQARFMLDKTYESERARTEPWEGVVNTQSSTNDELRKR